MRYAFIAQRCSDLPVAACCRVMGVSTSGFYAWQANPVSNRDWDDAVLTNTVFDIHRMSRRSYGSPRVHAELVLGQGHRCSRKRVARLMAQAGIVGIHRRKGLGCTRRDAAAEPAEDLVKRSFDPAEPDPSWVMDVTEHPSEERTSTATDGHRHHLNSDLDGDRSPRWRHLDGHRSPRWQRPRRRPERPPPPPQQRPRRRRSLGGDLDGHRSPRWRDLDGHRSLA